MIKCLRIEETDPFLNLATEEFLLKHSNDEYFLLWQNAESIIVGRHQNIFAEVNVNFAESNNIPIARRLSGGGTVFHDLGNINLTLIRNRESINFDELTALMLSALLLWDIHVTVDSRYALFTDRRKFSGCAGAVHHGRTLHHATLLFNSHIDRMFQALAPSIPECYSGKAPISNRSRVINLSELIQDIDVIRFSELLFQHISSKLSAVPVSYKSLDLCAIRIFETNYRNWDAIYGRSPRFVFHKYLYNNVLIEIAIERGRVVSVLLPEASNVSYSPHLSAIRNILCNIIGMTWNEVLRKLPAEWV
ncbi:MAG: hypothetical protein LBR06_04365 [Bacteroidales bacterium]|jgi:lipoate-protein ligase A|nr:hypothetical protein [Bacteroidales bacterium]